MSGEELFQSNKFPWLYVGRRYERNAVVSDFHTGRRSHGAGSRGTVGNDDRTLEGSLGGGLVDVLPRLKNLWSAKLRTYVDGELGGDACLGGRSPYVMRLTNHRPLVLRSANVFLRSGLTVFSIFLASTNRLLFFYIFRQSHVRITGLAWDGTGFSWFVVCRMNVNHFYHGFGLELCSKSWSREILCSFPTEYLVRVNSFIKFTFHFAIIT